MIRTYVGIALLLAAIAGGWYYGHARYMAGRASVQMQLQSARLAQSQAQANVRALKDAQAKALADMRAQSKARREAAQKAVTEARREIDKAQASRDAWMRKFEAAKKAGACKQLLERKLCPAVAGY